VAAWLVATLNILGLLQTTLTILDEAAISLEQARISALVQTRCWDKFKEHGVEISFPQRDLHLRTSDTCRASPTLDPGSVSRYADAPRL